MGSQLTRGDWIALGLNRLRDLGPAALRIEALCLAAGRTKGSFYHHFVDLPDFISALSEAWLRISTTDPIARIGKSGDVAAVRKSLARFASQLDHDLERQMRRLAQSDGNVDAVVRVSDERRMNFLVQQFQSLGLSREESRWRAQVQHCFFVGLQIVYPEETDKFRQTLDRALAERLWTSDGSDVDKKC